MALGLQTETKSAGDILPIIKYNSQSGDFVRVDRFQTADGTWDKEEQELAFPMEIIMDLGNIEVGWISFEGGGPSFEMAKLGEPMPERPTPKHNQGFRVKMPTKSWGCASSATKPKQLSGSWTPCTQSLRACNRNTKARFLSCKSPARSVCFQNLQRVTRSTKPRSGKLASGLTMSSTPRTRAVLPKPSQSKRKWVWTTRFLIERLGVRSGTAAPHFFRETKHDKQHWGAYRNSRQALLG